LTHFFPSSSNTFHAIFDFIGNNESLRYKYYYRPNGTNASHCLLFNSAFKTEIKKLNKICFKLKYYFTKCNKSKFAHIQKITTTSNGQQNSTDGAKHVLMEKSRSSSSTSNQSSNQSSQSNSVLKNISRKFNFKSWFNSPKLPSSPSTFKNGRKASYAINRTNSDIMKHSLSEPSLNEQF
jgi:hypothetical protein